MVSGFGNDPSLITPAVESELNNFGPSLKGCSWEIEIKSGVGKLNKRAVKNLILTGYLLELPSALTSLGISL